MKYYYLLTTDGDGEECPILISTDKNDVDKEYKAMKERCVKNNFHFNAWIDERDIDGNIIYEAP